MYEALATSMEAVGRPQADIERVVLSLADFGTADFGSLMYSAAYLVRLGREAAGLRLYREAARMLPEQPEPYVLGLRLARKLKDADGIEWAASGILQTAWGTDYQRLHREAENAVAEALQALKKSGAATRAEQLQASLAQARQRDLVVRLVWSGEGDLDLFIEEPARSICSYLNPETPGGGVLVREGHGPIAENCREEYICARGQSGEYRISIRRSFGTVVGNRATLTVIRHQGGADEQLETYHLTLAEQDSVVRVQLDGGRRESLRSVPDREATVEPQSNALGHERLPRSKVHRALAEFESSRSQVEGVQIRRTGAIGYRPVIQTIPDGATFTARATISPDRRYVRIGVNPVFSNITDVFTFTFFGGGPLGNVQPGVGGGGGPGAVPGN